MPHRFTTDRFNMAERIRVSKLQRFDQDVHRSINVNHCTFDCPRVKEIS